MKSSKVKEMEKMRDNIRNYLAKDDFDSAFKALEKHTPKNSTNYRELSKLMGAYEFFISRERRGLYSNLETQIELNKFRNLLLEITNSKFPSGDRNIPEQDLESSLGYLDYLERFQHGFLQLSNFVQDFHDSMSKYREETSRNKNNLEKAAMNKNEARGPKYVNNHIQSLIRSSNNFATKMESSIPSFLSSSDDLLNSLYKAYIIISKQKIKGKILILRRIDTDFNSLIEIYRKFKKISESGLSQKSKIVNLSSQLTIAFKRVDKIYYVMNEKTDFYLTKAKSYKTEMGVILFREELKEGRLLSKFRNLLKSMFR